MSETDIVQLLCGTGGAMEYDLLLELAIGFPDIACYSKFDSLLRNEEHFFLTDIAGVKQVLAKTSLRLCKLTDCNGCKDLHLCKFYLHGECNRNVCPYGHDLNSNHNVEVLSDHQLEKFSSAEIRQLLLQNDTPHTLLPPICAKYNRGDGDYGQCEDKDACNRLHVCEDFMRHTCDGDTCGRSHDLFEPQPIRVLCERGVLTHQVGSMRSVYHHILLLRGCRQGDPVGGGAVAGAVAVAGGNAVAKRRRRRHGRSSTVKDKGSTTDAAATGGSRDGSSPAQPEVAEICLSFVIGFCKYENRCVRVHCKMPYLWQVRSGDTWSDLDNNEDIERDYCNPNCITTFSVQGLPVLFDSMRCGNQEVRRLSTAPSVQKPDFILTTQWIWYWRDEQFTWNPYIPPMCWDLEKRFQADSKDVFLFMDGRPPYQQQYALSFRDMQQRNMCPGTKRRPLAVRRRPRFISAKDVQTAIARKRRGRTSSQPARGVTQVKSMVFYASPLAQSHNSTLSASSIAVDSTLKTVTVSTPTSSFVTAPPAVTPPPVVSPPLAQTSGNVVTTQKLTPTPLASRQLVSSAVTVSSPPTKLHTGSSLSSLATSTSRDPSVDDLLLDLDQLVSPSSKFSDPARVLPAASAVSTAKRPAPVPTSSRSTSGSSASASGHPSQTAQTKHGDLSIDDLLLDLDEFISPSYFTNPSSHPQSPKSSDPARVLPAASTVPTTRSLTPVPPSSKSTPGSSVSSSSHTRQSMSGSSVSSSSHTSRSISGSSVSPSSHLSQTAHTKYRDPNNDDWLLVDPSGVPKTRSDPLRSTASIQRAAAASRAQFAALESSLYASTAGSAAPPVPPAPPASRRMFPPPPHLSTTTTSLSSSSSSSSLRHTSTLSRDMYNMPVSGALPRSSSQQEVKKKEEKCILQ